jgi:ketosteroid isomerase-like protein
MFAEVGKGNVQAFLGAMADDVRFTVMGTTRFSGTCNGKQEVINKLLGPLNAQLELASSSRLTISSPRVTLW